MLKYLTKECEIPEEEDKEDKPGQLKIYEGNGEAWDLLIISLTDITFELVRQYNENKHKSWKALIDKYEVSDDKQENLNQVTNR